VEQGRGEAGTTVFCNSRKKNNKGKKTILVNFSLKLHDTPMLWSRGMKAGNELAFVSRICLLQFLPKSTQIWQSCQAFKKLGSCIFSSKELDFSGA